MAAIHLTQYRLIEVAGIDAEKYLQGQVTADVTKLEIGASTLTAHCDPKGKITGLFRLIRLSAEQFYLFIRADLLPTAVEQLKKYAVFSKVTFSPVEANIVGTIDENTNIPAQVCVEFGNRKILINPESAVDFSDSFILWDLVDIQQGYPILSNKAQGEFIPQALNLQAIEQAISFSKGCYIGQETIARAKYRGANKRMMVTFKAETEIVPDIAGEIEMQLENGWRKTGTILSAVNVEGVLWLQVVLSNQLEEHQAFRLAENQTTLEMLALPYSL
ncbi:folate-binding protein YgfZ [uncultured Actinobacillus sp.]|uniref:CAF17-like 4Fe-4S cluster assembly/insertion protein YgfZ n=1 Tax=uncultured Actinobacillus sp. TaxID=417616 RepID=UPI0025DED049|nr:folate-binding protein YgfZ [uncultured Actinobacillus sp.]